MTSIILQSIVRHTAGSLHTLCTGMRQQVYRYHSQRSGYRIVTRSSTYLDDMATSKYCLAPTGGGHGKRQVSALQWMQLILETPYLPLPMRY
jgi:hypothetical protein